MFLMQISKIKRKIYLLKEQNTNDFNVAGKNCFCDKIQCICFTLLPNNANKSGDVAYS